MGAKKTGDLTANKFMIKIALNLVGEAAGVNEAAPESVAEAVAPHVGKTIKPRLGGLAVDEHEAIAITARGDAVAVANVHAHDIECRFRWSE